ncbi:MAG: ribosomal protein S18-alanine N-acetyltransferase [Niameybacter sp.]|uniref:ribosomal protein S18-alanine N-acetyltransferase n=1 Tax=Niameybacter sp. TaxID=2033640 RepID=UPI002FCB2864
MDIRKATLGDVQSIYEIEVDSFSVPWSLESIAKELESSVAYYLIAEEEGQVLGYAGLWNVVGEGQITNIAVRPSGRRKGIGKQLIEGLMSYGQDRALEVLILEVRASNEPAINLYTGAGFTEVGKRKNYYTKPTEDALLMAYAFI